MKRFAITSDILAACLALAASLPLQASGECDAPLSPQGGFNSPDPFTLAGPKNFLTGYEPVNADGSVNVVVEIPAGTNAKWEVSKPEGELRWTFQDGSPRVVNYLAYPGNYGMIPRTLLTKESGGDGDPLDVLILGPAVPRGCVIAVRVLGVLHLLDRGEKDDKIIAVPRDNPLFAVTDLKTLDASRAGILDILELWFSNYKSPGEMRSLGYGDVGSARDLLDAGIAGFANAQGAPRR